MEFTEKEQKIIDMELENYAHCKSNCKAEIEVMEALVAIKQGRQKDALKTIYTALHRSLDFRLFRINNEYFKQDYVDEYQSDKIYKLEQGCVELEILMNKIMQEMIKNE